MQLDEDPLSFLGRSYAEVRGGVGGLAPESVFEVRDEGEPDELCAEASDGRWQCMLDAEGNIETIFLFAEKGSKLPFRLASDMSQPQVLEMIGEPPTTSKPERDVPVFGWAGAFLRWDRPGYCMHAEFGRNGRLRQLTLMVPKRAPRAA
jgi:hypothetical protein